MGRCHIYRNVGEEGPKWIDMVDCLLSSFKEYLNKCYFLSDTEMLGMTGLSPNVGK